MQSARHVTKQEDIAMTIFMGQAFACVILDFWGMIVVPSMAVLTFIQVLILQILHNLSW